MGVQNCVLPVGQISDLRTLCKWPMAAARHGELRVSHPIAKSDFLELIRRNGDFRRNYGLLIGACLYVLSLRAVSGRSIPWVSAPLAVFAAGLGWLARYG